MRIVFSILKSTLIEYFFVGAFVLGPLFHCCERPLLQPVRLAPSLSTHCFTITSVYLIFIRSVYNIVFIYRAYLELYLFL